MSTHDLSATTALVTGASRVSAAPSPSPCPSTARRSSGSPATAPGSPNYAHNSVTPSPPSPPTPPTRWPQANSSTSTAPARSSSCPSRRSSPWIRTTPQVRFCRAGRTISSTRSSASGGRPGGLGWRHFAVRRRRCPANRVPGVMIRCPRSHFGNSRAKAASTDPTSLAVASASRGAVRRSRAGQRVSLRPWTPGIWPAAPTTSTPAPGVDRQVARPQTTIIPDGAVSRSGDRCEQDPHSIGPENLLVKPSIGVLE